MATAKLIIYGNPDGHAGIKDLITNQHAEDWDCYYNGYSVFIKPTETIILKNSTNISSKSASRKGVLRIGISIPKGFHLDRTYLLVSELENLFLKRFTEEAFGNRQFSKLSYDEVDFQDLYALINKFTLSLSYSPYRLMDENGDIAYVSTELLSTFLDDVQYPEFMNFKEIVINSGQEPTLNIQVPRAACYTISTDHSYLLTTSTPTVSNLVTRVSIAVSRGENYVPVKGEFSVEELLSLQSYDKKMPWGEISLDKEREQIFIRVNKWEKRTFEKKINLFGVKNDEIILFNDKETLQIPDSGMLKLDGEQVETSWKIICSNRKIELESDCINFKESDTVNIYAKRKDTADKNTIIPESQTMKVYGRIVNPQNISTDLRCCIFFFSHEDKKIMWVFTIPFRRKEVKRGRNGIYWIYEGSLPVPSLKEEMKYDIRLNLEEYNIHFKKEDVSCEGQSVDLGEDLPGDGRKKTIRLAGTILLCILCFLIGIAGGAVGTAYYNDSDCKNNIGSDSRNYLLQIDSLKNVISNYSDSIYKLQSRVEDLSKSQINVQITKKQEKDLNSKYVKYLQEIHRLEFSFSSVDEIEGFLKTKEVKEHILPMKKSRNEPQDSLSLCVAAAKVIRDAIKTSNPDKISNDVMKYTKSDVHKYLGDDIKKAISHLYEGCIGEDKDNYATAAKYCQSYKQLLDIQ